MYQILITNKKYIISLLFLNSQAKSNWVSKLYVLLWENHEINRSLGTVTHDWTSIIWQWASRKHFLSARGNILNSNVAFYNITTCLLRHRCFNRYVSVVTPAQYYFSMISPNFLERKLLRSFAEPVPFHEIFTPKN